MKSLGKSSDEGMVSQSLVRSLVVIMVMVMMVVVLRGDDGGGSHLHYYSFSLILLWSFIHTVFQEFARCNIVAWRLATSWAIQAIWNLIFAATKVDCWECQPSSCSWDLKHFSLAGSSRVLTLCLVLFGQDVICLQSFPHTVMDTLQQTFQNPQLIQLYFNQTSWKYVPKRLIFISKINCLTLLLRRQVTCNLPLNFGP